MESTKGKNTSEQNNCKQYKQGKNLENEVCISWKVVFLQKNPG